jgi:hypothetical protein
MKMEKTVYVLFDPAMPSLTMIGVLDDGEPTELMEKIYTGNVPLPYGCVYACTARYAEEAERSVCEKFAAEKISPHDGFFDLAPERIVEVLRPYEVRDVTEDFRAAFDFALTDGEKDVRAKYPMRPTGGSGPNADQKQY